MADYYFKHCIFSPVEIETWLDTDCYISRSVVQKFCMGSVFCADTYNPAMVPMKILIHETGYEKWLKDSFHYKH